MSDETLILTSTPSSGSPEAAEAPSSSSPSKPRARRSTKKAIPPSPEEPLPQQTPAPLLETPSETPSEVLPAKRKRAPSRKKAPEAEAPPAQQTESPQKSAPEKTSPPPQHQDQHQDKEQVPDSPPPPPARPKASPRRKKSASASSSTPEAETVATTAPNPGEPPSAPPAPAVSAASATETTGIPADAATPPQPAEHPAAASSSRDGQTFAGGQGHHPTRAEKDFRRGSRRFRNRRQRFRERMAQATGSGGAEPGSFSPEKSAYPPAEEIPVEEGPPVFAEGVLELSGKGFGFLRDMSVNFDHAHAEIFVPAEIVRHFNLRDGLYLRGQTRRAPRGPQLFRLTEIEGQDPSAFRNLPVFEELTVLNPLERLRLETVPDRLTTRVIDIMAPIGKGTRGLLVAPPRTGKTTLLQHIAEAVITNYPEIKVILLLVDERPEEVTELRRSLPQAEVMASSNDSEIKSHTRISQLAIDRAKRLVEMGRDVVVLMDSLTRIGRAFNNAQSGKGRTMSGGVDSRALEIPRKLFAAARNTEEAGSLTIMATALIETGSRMDDLIFLEFKGTGNMELVLDRKISEQRIYPAADIFQSGTRREELLLPADALHKINVIRRGLSGHKPIEAIERLLYFLRKYPTNQEMLVGIPG